MTEKAGSETVIVSIRMDKELKQNAEGLFAELGMNMTTAINVFAKQSVREGKIPFEISLRIPNAVTLAAMQEVEDMISGKIPKNSMSVDDFLKEQ